MVVLLAVLGACTALPDPAAPLTEADRSAPYPALVPAETLLATVPAYAISPDSDQAMADRLAGLAARAAALRDTALEPETRSRMQAGVARDSVPPAP